ncbi:MULTISPECIES: hypothetical protein [unclassified Novosphingobium]|uniref:hypothetical protein n=1 Tax=unclassified Novosphingobium TaxID=2644732 RepID=UPI0025E254FD|nr:MULTISPECIES: hypothetical protein [unclassified Novosphingobium]HQS70004.1 hypothetical protein [Novosphingobium sp.]
MLTENANSRLGAMSLVRPVGWSAAAIVLLFPMIAMQFEQRLHWGVNWTVGDFVAAALLLSGTGAALELAVRLNDDLAYRAGAFLGIGAALLMVWANLAVGLVGSEDNAANLWFMTVPVVGLAVAMLCGVSAKAMVRAMLAMAFMQFLAGLFVGRAGAAIAVSMVLGACWLVSAWLFSRAA